MDTMFAFPDEAPAARFLTERDLTRALGLSRTTLWRLRRAGLPTLLVGRSVRYDLEKVRRWLAVPSNAAEQREIAAVEIKEAIASGALAECHWSLAVAFDPKHRPQEPTRPSSTARREWWRYPQEAHLLDRVGNRYRRLVASEVAAIQGFPAGWGRKAINDEALLLRGYGDAVPPPLAEVLSADLPKLVGELRTGIEICSGFGGLALGEQQGLGIHHLALLERWDVACEVLRRSGAFDPNVVREVDLEDVDWSEFSGRVDLLSGGPPCQPWSQGGQGRGAEDERDLLGSTPLIVAQVRPKAFFFENVPGFLSGENEGYARKLIQRLRDADGPDSYGVALAIFNAADFGIAQTRRRVFIVGARGRSTSSIHDYFDGVAAKRTHAHPRSAATLGLAPWRRIADVVTDWPTAKARWHRWPAPAASDLGAQMEETVGVPTQPDTRRIGITKRIGVDWPSRGQSVHWNDGGWVVTNDLDTLSAARAIPLLPKGGEADPVNDPWLIHGDPCPALDILRRQIGRDARLVYVDLPRIKTNAATFDATDRESILDTWLSVTRAIIRRALSLLEDQGAIAVLCGIDESPYARLLLDELAGPQNHLGTVAWQKNYSPRNMKNMRELSPVHDDIILYARRLEALPPVSLRIPEKDFTNRDGDPRGAWKAEQKGANKPDCDYDMRICPYRWELVSGELPPGIWRVSPKTGVLWGKPEASGKWSFVVRVTDKVGATAERAFEIQITDDAAPPPLAHIPWLIVMPDNGDAAPELTQGHPLIVVTGKLPIGRSNEQYSACILAKGGSPWIGITRPGKTSVGGKSRYWDFPASTLLTRAAEDSVDFKGKDDAIPALKIYADGADQRLNQTTMWFGRVRKSAKDEDAGDPAEVDYSQDAKKELEALQAAGVISLSVPTSKPAKLMARLLALFSGAGSTVIDIGSPAAEMASLATAAGRRAVYVALKPDQRTMDALWVPRLKLAARGQHPLPLSMIFSESRSEAAAGYVVDGAPRPANTSGEVFVASPSVPFAHVDPQLNTVDIDYESYPSGSTEFLNALASVEGLIPFPGKEGKSFARSRDGRILAVYVPASDWVERASIDEIVREVEAHSVTGGRVRIYYHRGIADPDRITNHRVEMRRIPFALVLGAGAA